jgi:hypothetical protein
MASTHQGEYGDTEEIVDPVSVKELAPVEEKKSKKQTVHLLDHVEEDQAVSKLIRDALVQEQYEFANEQEGVRSFYKRAEDQLLAPDEYEVAKQTGRLPYLRRCSDMNVPACQRFLKCIDTDLVDLRLYGLGEEGMVAISACLEVNSTISSFLIEGNAISERGAIALGLALQRNATITNLDVANNGIHPNVMEGLIHSLNFQKSVRSIVFCVLVYRKKFSRVYTHRCVVQYRSFN